MVIKELKQIMLYPLEIESKNLSVDINLHACRLAIDRINPSFCNFLKTVVVITIRFSIEDCRMNLFFSNFFLSLTDSRSEGLY